MKQFTVTILLLSLLIFDAHGQGQFYILNVTDGARTRLGSLDGPFAGPGIWAQMLVGTNADSLLPVGVPLDHLRGGFLRSGDITVPDIPCSARPYFQMVAWDGNLWGNSLVAVPPDQLGRTDVVLSALHCFPDALFAPLFTHPAVVPVPEPVGVGLGLLGGALLLARWRARRVR